MASDLGKKACVPLLLHDDLAVRVTRFLAASNIPALREVSVSVTGDRVVLSGQVRTFYERQMAAQFAQRVAGVVRLDDQLQVRGYVPRGESPRHVERMSLQAV